MKDTIIIDTKRASRDEDYLLSCIKDLISSIYEESKDELMLDCRFTDGEALQASARYISDLALYSLD